MNKRTGTIVVRILSLAVLLAMCIGAAADDLEDYYIQHALQRYFSLPLTARTLGMAGSSVVTSKDVSSVLGNPAGLGWLQMPEISLNYQYSEISGDEIYVPAGIPGAPPSIGGVDEDFNRGSVLAAIPFQGGEYGALGLGLSLFESDVDDYFDSDTDGFRLHLAYGLIVEEVWTFGYSLTYFNAEEDSQVTDYEMDDGFRHTIGAQVEAAEDWLLGLSIFYASADPESEILTVGDLDGDADSWGFDFGAAWQATEQTLLAASFDYADYSTDVDLPAGILIPGPGAGFADDKDEDGDTWAIRLGIEHYFTDCFVARAGYRYQSIDYDFDNVGFINNIDLSDELSGDADYSAGALGFGIHFTENILLDYGFEYRAIGDGDMSHGLSLVYRF